MDSVLKYFPELSDLQIKQFSVFLNSFFDWNQKINLVSRKDMGEFTERHILHSLAIAKAIKFAPGSKILDVGTGGGLPGIPLAIIMPNVKFTLCDSVGKKIRVVQTLIDEIGLKNVETTQSRADAVTGNYDFVVSRAVTKMSNFLPWIENKIEKRCINAWPNGVLYLKGGDLREELSEVKRTTEILPISKWFKEEFFETKSVVYVKLQ